MIFSLRNFVPGMYSLGKSQKKITPSLTTEDRWLSLAIRIFILNFKTMKYHLLSAFLESCFEVLLVRTKYILTTSFFSKILFHHLYILFQDQKYFITNFGIFPHEILMCQSWYSAFNSCIMGRLFKNPK